MTINNKKMLAANLNKNNYYVKKKINIVHSYQIIEKNFNETSWSFFINKQSNAVVFNYYYNIAKSLLINVLHLLLQR